MIRRLSILLIPIVLAAIALPPLTANAEPIAHVRVQGLETLSEERVIDVLDIEPGEEFSLERLDRAVSHLRKWGVFDSIQISPEQHEGGIDLTFYLKEATVVAGIFIDGNYPFLETKLRKYLTLHVGEIYTPKRLADQIKRLDEFYKRQGYFDTQVLVEEEADPEVHGVILTFHIKRGIVLRYRTVTIDGNRAYPDGRFVSAINTWKPYSERRLRESLEDLREFYHHHGYPLARIRVKEKRFDFDDHRIDLALTVDEGPHVEVRFEGSPHTSRRLLRRTITLFDEGSIDTFEIEASVEELRTLFHNLGYPHARITSDSITRKDGTILITFRIRAGESKRIKFLHLEGRKDVRTKAITEEMKNQPMAFKRRGAYLPKATETDDEAIATAMRRKGYLEATVADWDVRPTKQGYTLDIIVPIEAGPQTVLGEVLFDGADHFTQKQLMKALDLRLDKPFNEPELPRKKQRLLTFLADNGFPYAQVRESYTVDKETHRAVVRFDVVEGELVHIGRILFLGDLLTSQKALTKAMSIRRGDIFSYRKILESQLNIRRLGAFSSVSIETIGLDEKLSVVHLRVKVEEARPFRIDTELSFSTRDKLSAALIFMNRNAFGWAKTNSLKLAAGQKLAKAELAWHDPRFFSSDFQMSATSWVQYKQEPVYSYTQYAGALSWFRTLRRWNFLFRYEIDRNYFVEGDSTAADADSLRNNTISQIAVNTSFDSRDSFSDPTRGFYTYGGVTIYNEILGDKADFVRFSWQGENDLTLLWWRLVLATDLRFDRIQTIGSNVSVPTNELLFLGGADTIRGYAEDSLGPVDAQGKPTGGRTRWIWNEELRLRIWKQFQLVAFFDMGSLTNTFSAINWNSIRRSVGTGLRYVTPVGPIRAEYGFKLDRKPGESLGHFHFTFGYVF